MIIAWIAGADNNININVESRQDDNDNIKRRDGYAKVYSMNHNGEWVQRGRTILGSNGSWTGYAVAMSGDGQTICVSDRFYSVRKGFQPGRVRCFKWWHTDWRKLGGDLLGDYHRENIGYSLSLNGDGTVVAIGAPRYGSGSVRVYSLQGDGCWKIRVCLYYIYLFVCNWCCLFLLSKNCGNCAFCSKYRKKIS